MCVFEYICYDNHIDTMDNVWSSEENSLQLILNCYLIQTGGQVLVIRLQENLLHLIQLIDEYFEEYHAKKEKNTNESIYLSQKMTKDIVMQKIKTFYIHVNVAHYA